MLVALTYTACSDAGQNPTDPFAASSLGISAVKGVVSRPAGGRCTTVIEIVPTRPGAVFSLQMTGECILKHLGRTTIVISQDIFPDCSARNSTTHTAANGDLLYSTWYSAPGENSFIGGFAVFTGIETYVGGTGRFADATGSSRVDGTARLDFATGEYTGQYTTKERSPIDATKSPARSHVSAGHIDSAR